MPREVPTLPPMPRRSTAKPRVREEDPVRALRREHDALDTLFEVWRTVDGERGTVLVHSHELTPDEVAALSPEQRAAYEADETRWGGVFDEIERIAAAEETASRRDGETAVHNGEPDSRTLLECQSEAAAAAE